MMPTALLLAACLTDIKYRKVLNWFVVASFLCIIGSHFIFSSSPKETFFEAGLGFGMAVVLTLPLYLMRALGGGDLKIFAVFGFATNVDTVIFTFLAALVWGSLLGVIRAIFNNQGDVLLSNFLKIIKFQTPEPHTLHKIPFTVALLAGWFSYIIYSSYGRIL
jgi:Flp pilus assembly protein protease CpaA